MFHRTSDSANKCLLFFLFIMLKSTKSFLHDINLISRSKFTMEEINYFSNSDISDRYRLVSIPKRDSLGRFKKRRKVYMPTPRLKFFLQQANILLSSAYIPPTCAFAFIKGKTIVGNATPHTNKKFILSLDIKDFFNSISIQKAVNAIQSAFPWKFRGEFIKSIVGASSLNGHLVQGSPLSPIISNIVCLNLDKRISRYCESHKISYTRYADDFTFSSNVYDFKNNSSFIYFITRLLSEEGFTLNEEKTHVQLYDNRQIVTGLVVNSKVNVVRRYIKELRSILYIWERYGYAEALKSYRFHYLHIPHKIKNAYDRGLSFLDEERILRSIINKHAKKYSPRLDQHILGRLCFLKMVRGDTDNQYLRLKEKFNALSSSFPYKKDKNSVDSLKNISYFEQILGISFFTDDVQQEGKTYYFKTSNNGKAVFSKKLISFLSTIDQEYNSIAISLLREHCRVKTINLEANLFLLWATESDIRKYHWAIADAVYLSASSKYHSIDCLANTEHSVIESLHKDFSFAISVGNYGMICAFEDICNYLHLNSGLYPNNFDILQSNDKSILLQKWGWYYYSLGIDTVPTDKDGVPLSDSTYSEERRQWGKHFAKLNWKEAEGIALVAGTNDNLVLEVVQNKKDSAEIMEVLRKYKAKKVFLFRNLTPLFLIKNGVLPNRNYQSFTLHKSGYFPIFPYKREAMECLNLSE